ncbi:MAG: carboxypeptidase-like regulatory domain-containing protein, partial [Saprospiraceae bacterium]|nr:carboxypeptidase-like regulatory domain-containing protein [Saprospiraceae bacterium]
MTKHISVIMCILMSLGAYAQGIKGRVLDEAGVALPYTTIYAVDIQKGTASNADGYYQLDLPEGTHQIVYQFLGYKTIQITISVGATLVKLDMVLTKEPTQLQTIEVHADQEDPAYTIMRKAIAKAKYHTQQLDEYTATSYIKGSGRLKKLPWLFRKQLEKEMRESGVDTATAFVTESVNEINYQRPNQFSEKVISVRKVGNDNNTSPNGFINSSFYAPEVNGAISPLSPRAFTHYKFKYLGFKAEQGHNINKILVVPRRPGDQVFDGIIYIVDDLWCLQSVDLTTYIWGIRFDIDQIYQPIEPTVWLPVNQTFDVAGSIFGFAFEYKYFAHIKDYDITLNSDLTFRPQVLDEKLARNEAKIADIQISEKSSLEETFSALEEGEEISRRKLRKVLKEYEEQQLEEFQTDSLVDVVSVYAQEVDSMAYERDSSYWTEIRPIPLTTYEVKGYKVMDSIS